MPITANIYYHFHAGCEEGKRPPLVLIHGAGGGHLYWPPELRRLPAYRVYALDLPGHGKSAGNGWQSIAAYVQAVINWLDAVGLYRVVLVGHSMGGAIAISLALNHPNQVLGLGLIGAGARLRVAPAILELAANPSTFYSLVDNVISWAFSPQASAQLTRLAAQRMAETRPAVLYGDFLACDAFDDLQRIHQISQPTLVLCGQEDRLTPLRYSQFLVDHLPNAVLKVIPDAGHMVMLEKPKEVAQALVDFLDGIPY